MRRYPFEHPMAEFSCTECHESLAEFALNILTGPELADLQAHLERSPHCRDRAADLAVTADRLVELLPEVEPPAGFSHRVADTLCRSNSRRRSSEGLRGMPRGSSLGDRIAALQAVPDASVGPGGATTLGYGQLKSN
jgi:anti-sigma factor RsiW